MEDAFAGLDLDLLGSDSEIEHTSNDREARIRRAFDDSKKNYSHEIVFTPAGVSGVFPRISADSSLVLLTSAYRLFGCGYGCNCCSGFKVMKKT